MPIYRVQNYQQFAEEPEIFAGVQMGVKVSQVRPDKRYYLVLGCQVAIEFDEKTRSDLDAFYAATWGSERAPRGIIELYRKWIRSLNPETIEPYFVTRTDLISFVAAVFPSPPPNRPDLTTGYPLLPSLPQNFYGHLPFKTTTRWDEHFYRFEPYPDSKKITMANPGIIKAMTYASPSAELPFLNTGFAAVARNALPSMFPAVFRYELQPEGGKIIHCGAIVPNYGQSGGGVEVYFPTEVPNRGPIANPVILRP